MPALVAGIHDFLCMMKLKDVDGRVKPGHDSYTATAALMCGCGS